MKVAEAVFLNFVNLLHNTSPDMDAWMQFSFLRYFEGYTPIIVTSDPDAAQQILIKDFHKFHSRKVNQFRSS